MTYARRTWTTQQWQAAKVVGVYHHLADDLLKPAEREPLAEPIHAWRVWRVEMDPLRAFGPRADTDFFHTASLASLSAGATWERVTEASCVHGCEPPGPNCRCGLWALKSREDAVELASVIGGTGTVAVGRVLLWGRAVEHERGWRAQFGAPASIELSLSEFDEAHAWADAIAGSLEHVYGVAVSPLELDRRSAEMTVVMSFSTSSTQMQKSMAQLQQAFATQMAAYQSAGASAQHFSAGYSRAPVSFAPPRRRHGGRLALLGLLLGWHVVWTSARLPLWLGLLGSAAIGVVWAASSTGHAPRRPHRRRRKKTARPS